MNVKKFFTINQKLSCWILSPMSIKCSSYTKFDLVLVYMSAPQLISQSTHNYRNNSNCILNFPQTFRGGQCLPATRGLQAAKIEGNTLHCVNNFIYSSICHPYIQLILVHFDSPLNNILIEPMNHMIKLILAVGNKHVVHLQMATRDAQYIQMTYAPERNIINKTGRGS